MKVAYFIGSLNRGGTEMLTLDICRKKDYAPFEFILVYRNDGELTEEFKTTGVPAYRIKPKGLKIGYFGQLRKLLKQEKVDIVHAQTLTNGVIAILISLFTHFKVVVSFHGFFYSTLMVMFRHFIMWNADAMVFVSGFVRDWYFKQSLLCPKQRCRAVYNGINFEKFDRKYEIPDFLEEENNGVKKLRFVMVGNFVSGRSQIVICKSLKLLKDQGVTDFDFYFVGRRDDSESWRYDECVGYCEQHGLMDFVHFVGSRGDVPAILQYVDGFVYSTNHDTFGIAVVEAIAAGVPVIVNNWKVMLEVTHDGEWAELYKSDDPIDCARAIQDLLVHLPERKKQAAIISKKVRELYSIENHIDALDAVYKSL